VKVRNVSTLVAMVPVDGGLAVGVNATVDVPDAIGQQLVESGQFEAVRITSRGARGATPKRAPSKPRKRP
jgi:hypothetical protein